LLSFDFARRFKELGVLSHVEMYREMFRRGWWKPKNVRAPGDFWLLRSEQISIQVRYGARPWYIREVAIGGPFLQGHVFRVNVESGALDDVDISWNGELVLQAFPDEFDDEQGLINVKLIENDLYRKSRKRWKYQDHRSLEIELPLGVRMSVNLVQRRSRVTFIDVFLTMPKQEGGQDGHCGRAEGDDKMDWRAWRVEAPDSLLSPKMLLLETERAMGANSSSTVGASVSRVADGMNGTEEADTDPCLEGGQEEFAEPCESVLNQTGSMISMLFLEACKIDVCAGGPEMLDHTAAVADQVYQKVVAQAAGAAFCEFAHSPGNSYMWDPTCSMGGLGCMADGKNIGCRFCGFGPYEGVPCR
jgi:hypothetical protein